MCPGTIGMVALRHAFQLSIVLQEYQPKSVGMDATDIATCENAVRTVVS
jgi:hypothetical protein